MSQFEKMGEILKVLAHPARLEIVAGLTKNECNVSQIQQKLGLPQSTISQHLRILRSGGIIQGRREGTKVCYAVTNNWAKQIIAMLEKG
jgi:DNA-binding transcriptional ArsR family regulator